MKEFLRDCFGIDLSKESIDNIIGRLTPKAITVYEMIRETISKSSVIGADETGRKVDGTKQWDWTYQTEKLTLLAVSESRGLKAMKAHFPHGFGNAVLCHDPWRAKQKISGQFKSDNCAENFCVIRSVVDILIKRSGNILENLNHIAKLQHEKV